MRSLAWLLTWLLALCVAWPLPAHAGTQCEIQPATPQKLSDATTTAMRVLAALEDTDAPVALVARVGTDLSKHGLIYSHVGFALRDHDDGRWTVLHLLNECGTARSALYAQGLVNFFSDDLVNQDARIVWLQPALAQRLANHLRGLPLNALHERAYNLIARPGSGASSFRKDVCTCASSSARFVPSANSSSSRSPSSANAYDRCALTIV